MTAGRTTRRGRTPRSLPESPWDVLAEIALIGYSLAVIFGFRRLFDDASFFLPLAATAISAHVLLAALRWARGGLLLAVPVAAIGALVTSAVLYPPTTGSPEDGFLSRAVLSGFRTDLELAWSQFQTVSAPTEVTAPFLLLIAIVLWLVVFLADWAAFRLRAPAEALIPGAAVYIFGSVFAAEAHRVSTAAVVVLAGLAVILLHRLGEAARWGTWLGPGARARGQASLFRVGAVVVGVTLIGGLIAAPYLPGYDEQPVWDLTDLDEAQSPRTVLSPLVDIQSKLISQPDVEVFTVDTDQPDYWRMTSLDVFDGRIWRSRGRFEKTNGGFDTDLPDGTAFDAVSQQFDVTNLGGIWVPAAYEPAELVSATDGVGFEYEPESGTLIVDRDRADSDGLNYTILSAIPSRDVAAITDAGEGIPAEISERYLELPGDFSQRARDQAFTIIEAAGAETPYEKALALQNFFRDPSLFRYSLDVSNGHSSQRLEDFLFEVRVGYCEQFAGTYAALARAVGLPARVAVGFTPGVFDEAAGVYRVSGKHAHAWPEVWIDGIGWLRFEPTPGRGGPRDEVYTGLPFDQAENTVDSSTGLPSPAPAPAPTPTPNTAPLDEGSSLATTTTVAPTSDRAESGVIGDTGVSLRVVFGWILAITLVLLIAVVPTSWGVFRARRQRRAVQHDPRRRIGLAWSDAQHAVRMLGVELSEAQTPLEVAAAVAETEPESTSAPLATLAEQVVDATYAPGRVDAAQADRAEALTSSLARTARAKRGAAEWWWQHASPINVWRDRAGLWGHLR